MGKFSSVEADVFSIFASTQWTAENIKTYPSNFIAVNAGTEYIRVTVIPSGNGINIKSVSGIVIVDIYTPAGNSSHRATLIADRLDAFFAGKSKSTSSGKVTQFTSGTLTHIGVDKDNSSLFRSSYTVPFNYYGV